MRETVLNEKNIERSLCVFKKKKTKTKTIIK